MDLYTDLKNELDCFLFEKLTISLMDKMKQIIINVLDRYDLYADNIYFDANNLTYIIDYHTVSIICSSKDQELQRMTITFNGGNNGHSKKRIRS